MNDTKVYKKGHKASRAITIVAVIISVCAILISLVALFHHSQGNLSIDNLVSLMGLLFSIVGVVATVYFVILSYRARLIRDDLNNEKKKAENDIIEAKKQWKEMVSTALNVIYQNYSFLIRENPNRIAEYRLQQSRLAIKLKLLDSKDRLEKIELLGTITRAKSTPDWDCIDDDIDLLKQVLFDSEEKDEMVKNKALESIEMLKKMKKT